MNHRDLSPEEEEKVRNALAARKKIQAIKIYREATGVDLRESKEAVEAMQRGTPASETAGTSRQARPGVESSGCGPSAICLCALAVTLTVGAMYGFGYKGYLVFLEDPEGKILHETSIPITAAKHLENARKLKAGEVYDRDYRRQGSVSLSRAVKNMR